MLFSGFGGVFTAALRGPETALRFLKTKESSLSKGRKSARDLAIESLRKRGQERLLINDLWRLIIDWQEHLPDDRSLALVLSSVVEQALEMAIATHFVIDEESWQRLFDDNVNGPLSNFAAKIKMGYALGIYKKDIRDELDLIRHIRNTFAHAKFPINFESAEMEAAVSALIVGRTNRIIYPEDVGASKSRFDFMMSVRMLYVYLENPLDEDPRNYATSKHYHLLEPPPFSDKSK